MIGRAAALIAAVAALSGCEQPIKASVLAERTAVEMISCSYTCTALVCHTYGKEFSCGVEASSCPGHQRAKMHYELGRYYYPSNDSEFFARETSEIIETYEACH